MKKQQKLLSLTALPKGTQAKIINLSGIPKAYRYQLLAMGLTPGTTIQLVRAAPLGDPIEFQVRGYALSLRKHEAQAVLVEQLSS